MSAVETLREQLMADLERVGDLAVRFALGDKSVKQEKDQLEGAVEIKEVILASLEPVKGDRKPPSW